MTLLSLAFAFLSFSSLVLHQEPYIRSVQQYRTMQVKQLVSLVPGKTRLFWERITLSRLTTTYFIFSLVHCIVQVILQARAFTINLAADDFLVSITAQGNASASDGFFVLKNDLLFCDHVPNTLSTSSCQVVWEGNSVSGNSMLPSVNASSNNAASSFSSTVTSSVTSTPFSTSATSTPSSQATSTSSISKSAVTSPAPTQFSSVLSVESATVSGKATKTTVVVKTVVVTPTPVSPNPPKDDDNDEDNNKDIQVHADIEKPSEDEESLPDWIVEDDKEDGDDEGEENEMWRRASLELEQINANGSVTVTFSGMGWSDQTATLDRQCLYALDYPVQVLRNTKREDAALIAFQIWTLGMSIVAILNESVPHILASLLTHLIATGGTAFQLFNTNQFREQFSYVATNGACNPINLMPNYWHNRAAVEIPSLVFNIVALLASAVLSWMMTKTFGWQTFKRVGACIAISRIYKLVLLLSVTIQLSLFFMVVSVALWLDQLWNGAIGHLSNAHYQPALVIVLILMVPWLMTGWFGVRKELKIMTWVFLVLCLGYLGGWTAMFASRFFRWTFVTWTYFALMMTTSVFLTVLCFALGVVCAMNFNKGLLHYLHSEDAVREDFYPVTLGEDPEKVNFPSKERPLTTYSGIYGDDFKYPIAPPGVYQGATIQSKSPSEDLSNRFSQAETITPSILPPFGSRRTLSQSSGRSATSTMTHSSSGSHQIQKATRWVIE